MIRRFSITSAIFLVVVTTPNIEGKKIDKYLDYETIQVGQGGGMLMVSANGTAVFYKEEKGG